MSDTHHRAVAGFDCRIVQRPGRGARVALSLTPTDAPTTTFELAPSMAERLAYALHYQCRCANVDPLVQGRELQYPADHGALHFDALTGSGVLSFSSRGMQPVQLRLGLPVLEALRNALARVR